MQPENRQHDDHSNPAPAKAAIFGHPIHPMLIPFPIAFLVGALATDLGAIASSDPFWGRVSWWLLIAGVVTGLAAAVPGLVDFVAVSRAREHRAGWIHMGGNVLVLLIALVNWLLRFDEVQPGGMEVTLSALTAGLLVLTGWYGGELAYRHMIGPTGHD